eukprot:scaffold32953_cov112-Isochrysis_galbana.AAC.4
MSMKQTSNTGRVPGRVTPAAGRVPSPATPHTAEGAEGAVSLAGEAASLAGGGAASAGGVSVRAGRAVESTGSDAASDTHCRASAICTSNTRGGGVQRPLASAATLAAVFPAASPTLARPISPVARSPLVLAPWRLPPPKPVCTTPAPVSSRSPPVFAPPSPVLLPPRPVKAPKRGRGGRKAICGAPGRGGVRAIRQTTGRAILGAPGRAILGGRRVFSRSGSGGGRANCGRGRGLEAGKGKRGHPTDVF